MQYTKYDAVCVINLKKVTVRRRFIIIKILSKHVTCSDDHPLVFREYDKLHKIGNLGDPVAKVRDIKSFKKYCSDFTWPLLP